MLHCINFQAILLGIGLQHKTVDALSVELELDASQLLGLFNRTIRRIVQHLDEIMERAIENTFAECQAPDMQPLREAIDDDLKNTTKV